MPSGGRRPGAGRPKKKVEDRRRYFREMWVNEWVTDADMQELCQLTMGWAKEGDPSARADVFRYILGNPPQTVEVTIREQAEKMASELGIDAMALIAEAERIVAR